MSQRELELEQQVKILSDRLALALMSQTEQMQAIVLLERRAKDRNLLRGVTGYVEWRSAISEVVLRQMQRLYEKEKAAA